MKLHKQPLLNYTFYLAIGFLENRADKSYRNSVGANAGYAEYSER